MATTTTPKASPALLARIDRLSGCDGHWLLIRDGEPERDCSHYWHETPEEHLATCLAERWRDVSLGFVPSCCGFSDYGRTGLVGLANYNVLTDPQSTPDPLGGILEIGYGYNGAGVVLDVLRAPLDVIESVEALEAYPLISDDEHSRLEWEGIHSLWEGMSLSERVEDCQRYGLSVFGARRDSFPNEEGSDYLRDSLIEYLNEYPTSCS